MAEAGLYFCVVNNSAALPVVVHSSIQPGSDEGRIAALNQAWDLFNSARGRIPFAVAEIHLYPMRETTVTAFAKVHQTIEERALELYPVEDGSYPGVDRNAQARAAYVKGRNDAR